MTFSLKLTLCFASVLSTASASAQATLRSESETSDPTPIAQVYVSNTINPKSASPTNEVFAYTAAANGKLTPVPGSPFQENVAQMQENGKYLLGVDTNAVYIDTFSIASDGALRKIATINAQTYNPGGSCGLGPIDVDHSGGALYNLVNDSSCINSEFQAFRIEQSTGDLKYLGTTAAIADRVNSIGFLANNLYAYATSCGVIDHESSGEIDSFQRNSNGALTFKNNATVFPAPVNSDYFYCPSIVATDPSNHLAISFKLTDAVGNGYGAPALGTYTADKYGNLTTTSTYKNMPTVDTGASISWMRMAPSGKLLAVGGGSGLEIFHFNGGAPPSKYADLLRNEAVGQFYWDDNNHLYILVNESDPGRGKLFVYTITPTSISEAPGSSYSIPNPRNIIVKYR